jgi:tRNA threonylcarbamoyladenosine dehydratase
MQKPIILNGNTHTTADLAQLKSANKIWAESDEYVGQLTELFNILNPSLKLSKEYGNTLKKFIQERTMVSENKFSGNYIYYPWSGRLIHILSEDEFNQVRTNRNQKIINSDEQKILSKLDIAFLGLSIGNGMALSLAYSNIGQLYRLADFDTLELSNLNRVRMSLSDLGLKKIEITARQIYEINPYAKLELFESGVDKNNLSDFLTHESKPSLIFEAIDDFEMKIRVRLEAKKFGIPVIMLTNLGDKLLIDVERYDLNPNLPLFNGLIGGVAEEILNNPISETDKQRYAVAIVGKENIPNRVIETIGEINKTIVGRPQVMSTVTVGGGIAAYLSRRIALSPELKSGRYLLNFEELIP